MSDRYFIDEPISPGRVVLAGAEAHHLIHVMRAAPGLRVVLFDGSGAEFPAVVQHLGRSEVELSVTSREEVNRELPVEVTLGVALPKGDRQKWLVEKAVELGVRGSCPCGPKGRRSAGRAGAAATAASRRRGLEAMRPQPPDADPAAAKLVRFRGRRRCAMSVPGSAAGVSFFAAFLGSHALPDRVLLAVGPEGGFTAEEAALAVAAGWHTLDLGPRILRVETAAILLAALVVAPCTLAAAEDMGDNPSGPP